MEKQERELEAAAVEAAVRERAKDGRLACREAFALAAELGIPIRRVGEAANAVGVKISACQLGCFK